MKTIVLTGGGTAGHCTPNLALIPYLQKKFDKIYYIGSQNGIEKKLVENAGIKYYSIPTVKLKRSFTIKNFSIPFKLSLGVYSAYKILKEIKPDIVFSKGGFVAVPTVIASSSLKIPVITHESDYSLGLANKLSAKFSKKILTTFPDTAFRLKNGEYIGSPIRKNLFEIDKINARSFFNFKNEKPILLVFGGSLGAKIINETLRQSLDILLKTYNIIHICGKDNLDKTIKKTCYYQVEYLENMEYAINACDIAVSRAGSNSLFELLALKIPCLVIPLIKGSRGDQIENARYFSKLGVINVLEEKMLTKNSLILNINSTYYNRENLIKNMKAFPIQDKSHEIVLKICEILQKDNQ